MRWLWSELGAGRLDVVIRGAGVLVVAGVLAGGGAYVIGGGGEAGEAHAFVNTDVSGDTCTRSSSPVTFAEAEAANDLCGSLDAANDVCQGGDTVLIRGGSYGGQSITGGNGRSSVCTMTVVEEETMTLTGSLEFEGAEYITLDGGGERNGVGARLVMDEIAGSGSPRNQYSADTNTGSSFVTLQGADFGGWLIENSNNVTYRNNDIGPCDSIDSEAGGGNCDNGSIEYCEAGFAFCTQYNEGHTVEYNLIHDFGCDDSFFSGGGSNDCHWECMYVSYPKDLVIRGNTFYGCANGGEIFFTFGNAGGEYTADYGYDGLLIENNFFTQTCSNSSAPCGGSLEFAFGISGHCNIFGGDDLTDVVIRFNTFLGGAGFDMSGGCTIGSPGVTLVGNVRNGQSDSCGGSWAESPTITYDTFYNGGSTCGTNGQNLGAGASPLNGLVVSNSNSAPDGHLTGAENDLDEFVQSGCNSIDIDGDARDTPCDAGADER